MDNPIINTTACAQPQQHAAPSFSDWLQAEFTAWTHAGIALDLSIHWSVEYSTLLRVDCVGHDVVAGFRLIPNASGGYECGVPMAIRISSIDAASVFVP